MWTRNAVGRWALGSAMRHFHSTTSAWVSTSHYRITLRRSAIGLPRRTGRVVEALGLRKRLQSVYHAQTPVIAGMILAIKELVHVENVRQLAPTSEQEEPIWVNEEGHVVDAGRAARKAPRGFKVVGNLMDEQRDASLRASRS